MQAPFPGIQHQPGVEVERTLNWKLTLSHSSKLTGDPNISVKLKTLKLFENIKENFEDLRYNEFDTKDSVKSMI